MLAEALQAEVYDYIARFVGKRDENGRRLVGFDPFDGLAAGVRVLTWVGPGQCLM
jgi:hypothetical protein